MVKCYNSYDEGSALIDFDFSASEPPVFRVIIYTSNHIDGALAKAEFRGPCAGAPHITKIECYGQDERLALDMLKETLQEHFGKDKGQ